MTAPATVRLTDYARCAGCAAKMGAADLARALAPLPSAEDPRLLVGRETFDDAGIFQLSADLALVQTVDFFAPIVDDPYHFGRVAAANALSDVFAMGGEPLTAMNIVGFPTGILPLEVLSDILRGGQDAVREAGAVIVGGHTITDEEVKYGLSVTGRVHPRRLLTNAAAEPGDVLVLTKPLGTGLVATAGKRGIARDAALDAMIASMETLNALAARTAVAMGVRCATDVTGFGILGHASHIARASGVVLELDVASLPVLAGAREAFAAGAGTGGGSRNARFVEGIVRWGAVSDEDRAILLDPQTSGGLLAALPAARAAAFCAAVPGATTVGRVEGRGAPAIELCLA
ncbi:MAG: selenide, water dikinase SelD [Gemmatimonadetes bacterium]|nr:selenide, water dikinase SelD [Gemmatimonadota bacterium]